MPDEVYTILVHPSEPSPRCGVAQLPDDLVARVARRLAEVRRERGITQEELAERLDTAERNVRRIEAGQNITLRTLSRIAVALGVHVVFDLAADDGAMKAPAPGRKRRSVDAAAPVPEAPNPLATMRRAPRD